MKKIFRKFIGVSLFEVLLVLVIASLMAVAAMRYAKQQQELSAAQVYGQELFVFGQAVRDYVNFSNLSMTNTYLPGTASGNRNAAYTPTATTSIEMVATDNNAQIIAKGVDWLKPAYAGKDTKGVPFLTDNFSFGSGLAPLFVAMTNSTGGAVMTATGDKAFVTTITFSTTNPTPTISIVTGALFEQSTGTKPPTLKVDMTQNAIQHANTMYTPTEGMAAVVYDYPYLGSSGTVSPDADVQGSGNATGGDIYLKIDGSNMMEGDITFDAAAMRGTNSHHQINNVNQIQFARWNDTVGGNTILGQIYGLDQLHFSGSGSGAGSLINNLTELDFDGSATSMIANVSTLAFQSLYPGNDAVPSSITGLNTLNFQISQKPGFINGPAVNGLVSVNFLNPLPVNAGWTRQISNLEKIVWANGTNFVGVRPTSTACNLANSTTMKRCAIGSPGDSAKMFCALGSLTFHDNVSNGSDKYCLVYILNNQWVMDIKMGTGSEGMLCTANCFYFAQ